MSCRRGEPGRANAYLRHKAAQSGMRSSCKPSGMSFLPATAVDKGECLGGSTLSLLHDKTFNYTGDSQAQELCLYLTKAASVPYFETLEKWIYRGVINDPYRYLPLSELAVLSPGRGLVPESILHRFSFPPLFPSPVNLWWKNMSSRRKGSRRIIMINTGTKDTPLSNSKFLPFSRR